MSKVVNYISCNDCNGLGTKKQGLSKKKKIRYEYKIAQLKENKQSIPALSKQKYSFQICKSCEGTGLISSENRPIANHKNHPHVAIIGAGIGGVALALACLHRQIPFTLYEKDRSFNERSQGYGLTLQQASKEMKKFGINDLNEGITSTLHIAHKSDGEIVGKWGLRNLEHKDVVQNKNKNKPTNLHIARQALRLALLNQLGGENYVEWNHQLIGINQEDKIELTFNVNGEKKKIKTDLLVGADGIRSVVRQHLIPDKISPLNYLGCIVILGICKLKELESISSPLLDGATVFQTANGTDRMYMMPFDHESIMWQFSFPINEEDAKILRNNGADTLKKEVINRTDWHTPIPQIIAATPTQAITGYPVYDRVLLQSNLLKNAGAVTLIGDAAHPMSPFKGQGANQALIDALKLAQKIKNFKYNLTDKNQIRSVILQPFEEEMIARSSVKVKKSAEAAKFLHSDIVLEKGNVTFGSKYSSLC